MSVVSAKHKNREVYQPTLPLLDTTLKFGCLRHLSLVSSFALRVGQGFSAQKTIHLPLFSPPAGGGPKTTNDWEGAQPPTTGGSHVWLRWMNSCVGFPPAPQVQGRW